MIQVATVGKTVGLKGELKLHHKTDFADQFAVDKVFWIEPNKSLQIESYKRQSQAVKFYGFDTVEASRTLINKEIYTTIDDTRENCALGSGEYFWFDIVGCEVIELDEVLGVVGDIQRYGDTDYLLINTSKTLVDDGYAKLFLIAYDKQQLTCDIKNKKIIASNTKAILESS